MKADWFRTYAVVSLNLGTWITSILERKMTDIMWNPRSREFAEALTLGGYAPFVPDRLGSRSAQIKSKSGIDVQLYHQPGFYYCNILGYLVNNPIQYYYGCVYYEAHNVVSISNTLRPLKHIDRFTFILLVLEFLATRDKETQSFWIQENFVDSDDSRQSLQ